MQRFIRHLAPLLVIGLLTAHSSSSLAEHQSYGSKVGHKALTALANLTTAPLEIPKNIINTTNQSNIVYGVAGGFLKGIINTVGRIGVGVTDLITFPIPTKPIAQPVYIWDDFDVDTTYGEVFRLDRSIETPQPAVTEPVSGPAATQQPLAAPTVEYEQPPYSEQETSDKMDALFEKKMMK